MQRQTADLTFELLGRLKSHILECLLTGDCTVSELAERFHVIRPGIRKHLEYLERIGLVSSFFKRSGLGRPKKYFTITPLGRSLFPKMYDHLLELLVGKLTKLRSETGETLSEKLLEETARELATSFNSNTVSLSFDQKLAELEHFLNRLGFSSKITKKEDGTISIIKNDCALYNVALSNYRSICLGFDNLLVSKCLNLPIEVKLERCMALGNRNCEHVIAARG